jgi:glycosyltransferase involved in cell wall biosynthesis
MRILFLHQNFPGQWLHLARYYASVAENEVVAITDSENKQPEIVRTYRYPTPTPDVRRLPRVVARFAHNLARAELVAKIMLDLSHEGFIPDVVAGHCGWGETLFVKEIWPETKLLIYGEYFYRTTGSEYDFDPEFNKSNMGSRLGTWAYNATTMLALAGADQVLTPTKWQRDTFPMQFHSLIEVIHDGIDTERIGPNPRASVILQRDQLRLTRADEVVTFVARNLEPYRGFHVFMRALPKVMEKRPHARIVIVGGDGTSYGERPPLGKTWKSIFLEEVEHKIDLTRVHFVGKVTRAVLCDFFSISTCHVYLTYPFILSWSVLEAMASECLVIGSATPPVQEVVTHELNGLLVDFFDVEQLAETIVAALRDPPRYASLRRAARETIIQGYDLRRKSQPRHLALIEKLFRGYNR